MLSDGMKQRIDLFIALYPEAVDGPAKRQFKGHEYTRPAIKATLADIYLAITEADGQMAYKRLLMTRKLLLAVAADIEPESA